MATIGEPIAVIGSACRFPGNANSPSTLWALLSAPRDLLTPIPDDRFSTHGFYHKDGQYHGHTNVRHSYLLAEGAEGVQRRFDAPFFGISPAEASVMDPQVRLLLETVFEALENSGQAMDRLQGSDTAVYAGLMVSDYEHLMRRDEESMGKYHVTGTASSLMSNRISYFFDWHGPSMTIDTACSSSLYAVHLAVQQLRSGASRVAVATGANLLLDPVGYVAESKLQMLSPSGRCRMWDADADGYGRGEGVAAVILKRLSVAEADGDHIDCIIRETGVNQDGRTKGITMPSAESQTSLIRACYARAGLDLRNPADRPQFFEAHGTGTPAGDPIEAEAIHTAFFANEQTGVAEDGAVPLYVGSVKTVIGHTEGTAGLAGLLKASLALQHGKIPPNLLFGRLNPRIEPFYANLQVPTSLIAWPSLPASSPRRASVNSFGFGGSNAHAILESYSRSAPRRRFTPSSVSGPVRPVVSPFIFTAASEHSLGGSLEAFRQFLATNGASLDLRDLAFTLHSRRTWFPVGVAFSATSADELAAKIGQRLEIARSSTDEPLGTRSRLDAKARPRILAVFTGQGAQWPRMAAELLDAAPRARAVFENLEARLARLPPQDRPPWGLTEELLKSASSSRVSDAALSQPLCTAVQILLVDLLHAAGIELRAAVGHSSGEIAAAYAAGMITAEDAICIAYYRGLHTKLARGPHGQTGAMLAVGTSPQDAADILSEPEFHGRACVAAVNSSASVTLSGDADAVEELRVAFNDEKKFARLLRVEKAYHSHHMLPCSTPYLESLRQLAIQVSPSSDPGCAWFSSVCDDEVNDLAESLKSHYWDRNMQSPVLFKQAVERACAVAGPFDMAIEIGPHPALKGPALQTLQDATGLTTPYTGLLQRGESDIKALAEGLGYISTNLGKGVVDFQGYETFMSLPSDAEPQLVKGLPSYFWNHENEYWHESRYARAIRSRNDSVHELLGHLAPNATEHNMQWRHLLCPKEETWLRGHQLQNQIVFPAAGYVVAALEASMAVLNRCGESALSIEVLDIEIGRALPFYSEESSVEVITSLSNIRRLGDSEITGHFDFSAATGKTGDVIESLARGSIRICLGTPSPATLPSRGPRPPSLIKLNAEDFYRSLSKLDYQYTDHFVALHDLERRLGAATGFVTGVEGSRLLVHPAVLDASFQSIILAASAPDDGKLWSMHVPTRIRRVRVNPYLCKSASAAGAGPFPFDASQPERVVLGGDAAELSGDVDLFPADGSNHAMVQVEGLECVPLAPATQRNDRVLFSSTVWGPATPDATLVAHDGRPTQHQQDLAHVLERVARFYLAKLEREVPTEDPSRQQGPYVSLFKFASHVLTTGGDGRHNPEWVQDTEETINRVSGAFSNAIDMRLLHAIGQRLTDIVMNRAPAIEVGMKDNLLEQFYREGLGMGEYLRYLGRVVKQILHLSPRIECLEIGAGTGAATEAVLRELVHSFPFSSYTFTDVSSGFFGAAETAFSARASPERLLFKVLDIGVDPCEQGFEEHSYDLIVASMVLHATPSLTQTLQNVRRLLKPGGYLVALEAHPDGPARVGTMFGAFPGWWVGAGEGRVLSPCASVVEWDRLLRETGFSGCDTTGPDSDPFVQPIMLFVSQAMDDRVAFLRDPLVHVFRPDPQGSGVGGRGNSPPLVEDLVLLGGQSIKTARITAELETLLRPWCSAVRRVRSLTDLHRMGGTISSGTIVLSVSDVDSPVFENITGAAWDALRLVLREAGSVLWVTKDRRAGNPFANMMVGLLRSVANERPDLEAQLLDIEDTGRLEARTIGEALLHFKASASWCREGSSPGHQSSICFKVEPELVIERGGSVVVPRLVADQAKNDRYNSTRRPIFSTTSIHAHVVSAVPARDGSGYFLRQEPAFQSTVAQETGIISDTSNRVSHSLLAPLRVAGHGHLFLSLSGIHSGNSSRSMILAAANASAVSPDAYLNLPVEIPSGFEPDFLYRVGLHYLISETFQDLAAGDRVLVHQADPELVAALRRRARRMDIEVTFVSSASHANTQSGHKSPVPDDCVELHTHSPERVFRVLKLASVSAFLDLAVTRESQVVAERIRSGLSSTCRCETLQTILGNQPRVPAAAQVGRVRERLEEAIAEARQDLGIGEATQGGGVADLRHRIKAVKLSQISGDASRHRDGGALAPISVIDWTAEDVVTTRVCPIDSMRQPLFLSNKTYWLVGLSGSLGLSLCRWMTGHGARHIVISSRKPNIDESWLGEMAVLGANIKVYACDVTKRDSLRATYADICANLPPVAGVAQGAMVLDDVGIGEMGLDTLQKVMRPKVEGSIHLSDLFQNPERNLDFFVLFSSVSSVIGTPGQAHYAAANTFMASLAQQRRQRGLTASIINIGPVYGVGYIAEQQVDTSTAMSWLAGMPISEQDFHALFAEGVVTGHPSSPHSSVEVTTGVKQVRLDEENLPPWSANPFMSHYVLNGQAAEHGEGSAARPKASLKTRLADALTQGEAQVYDLVREALIEKLGTLFQLDAKGIHTAALDTTRLDDLGLDSLIATEIRAWLMKNFQVTYPVLKLLSGVCVAELVKDVVDGIMAAADTPTTNARPPTPPESTSSDSPSSRMHQSLPADSSGETWTEATPSSSSAASDGDAMDDALQTRKADAFCPPVLASIGLSVTQKMFWIASTIFESRTSLNLAGVTRLTSTRPLRVQDLEKAVQAVGQQHESLRTSFFVSEGQPKQGILSSSLLRLEYRQISDVAEVKRAAREVQKHVYDIEHGETVRLILLSMSSNNHFLVVGATHLAMDGSSVQVLLRSVFQHYSRGQLVSAPIQYRDYLERQSRELATGTFEKELRFWKSQFPGSDFPPSLPILRVSRAVSRSSLARLDDVVVETRIAPETRTRIRAVCRQHRITPFHFYLAVFRVLLSRYADIDDLAIGILDANRNSRGSGSVTDGIGVFVNVLPLRFPNNSLSSKFDQVVQETRAVVLRALENSAVPFQAVLGVLDPPRSTTCTPVFQSCVNYRPGMDKLTIGDCELELLSVEASKTGYDLNLDVVDSADPDGMCIVKLIARSDLYQKVDADTLIKSYKILVEAFAEEPQAVLTEPNLYDSADVQTALMFSQGRLRAAQWPETVVHQIDQIAEAHPERVAVLGEGGSVTTYAELLRLTGSIAQALLQVSSGPVIGSAIGILQEPSPRWIASILAVMRLGGVYLPIDQSNPWARLAAIVKDCQPRLVLVDDNTAPHFSKLQQPDMVAVNVSRLVTTAPDEAMPPIAATHDGEAIILYTSGSLGAPKGVVLKHESIRNQIEWTHELHHLRGNEEVVMQQSASSFDLSYAQIFTALCFGASLYPVPRSLRGDARAITRLIASAGITYTFATPTEYSSWLRYGETDLLSKSSWRTALSGGEALPLTLLKLFEGLQKADLRLFNIYGPTEATVLTTSMEIAYHDPVSHDWGAVSHNGVPAGFVIPNCSLYVVDEQFRIVPPGVQGELYHGGAGVSAGYVNNPGLTAEKFVPDVFATDDFKARGWTKMHRVGDLGRWNGDGSISLEGRTAGDTQVKVRGNRVDLREIESALVAVAGGLLSEAVVSVRRPNASPESPEILVAHVVCEPTLSGDDRDSLLQSLPSSLEFLLPRYAQPTAIVPLQQLPRTSSAKLDRRAIAALPLPEPTGKGGTDADRQAHVLTETEARLRDIWADVLTTVTGDNNKSSGHMHGITPESDFFHVGGTSLLLLKLQVQIQDSFDVNLPIIKLFEYSSLGAMARLVELRQPAPNIAIDWEKETALAPTVQAADLSVADAQGVAAHPKVIVLTGSTGYLGRALLAALAAEGCVERIHCIGVRDVQSRVDMLNISPQKIRLYEGDLKLPRLGLSEDDVRTVFSEADRIIHNGAEVSHLQSYHSLRPSNLQSTKELVQMSAQAGRRIPLHFVSTAQVGIYYRPQAVEEGEQGAQRRIFPEVSVATHPPLADGSVGGYPATKWASERFLERVDDEVPCGWPIFIHRPSLISRDDPDLDIVSNIRFFARRLAAIPAVPHLHGYLHTVTLRTVVDGIVGALRGSESGAPGVRYRHYYGQEMLPLEDPVATIFGSDGDLETVQQLPPKEWARKAVALGMHMSVAQWVESLEGEREQDFPQLARGIV